MGDAVVPVADADAAADAVVVAPVDAVDVAGVGAGPPDAADVPAAPKRDNATPAWWPKLQGKRAPFAWTEDSRLVFAVHAYYWGLYEARTTGTFLMTTLWGEATPGADPGVWWGDCAVPTVAKLDAALADLRTFDTVWVSSPPITLAPAGTANSVIGQSRGCEWRQCVLGGRSNATKRSVRKGIPPPVQLDHLKRHELTGGRARKKAGNNNGTVGS